ncbi:STAS domain-containing protein [Blastococcus sp. SYSU D00669]
MIGSAPPHPPGSISIGTEDGEVVLYLRGDIDTATVNAFDDGAATAAGDGPGRVSLVDASAVTFISSIGASFLLRQTEAARALGVRPKLRHPSRSTQQLLRITGLADLFDPVG